MFARFLLLFTRFAHVILGIGTPQSFPPPLKRSEETELFNLSAKGDEDARSKLILHNLRLVAHIVKKYYSAVKCQDDLISIGSIGLVKAVDSFSVEKGAKFATYASKCIQNEILMFFRSQKKLCAEISINETIDVDRDGNPLTYTDILCSDENVCEETERKLCADKLIRLVESQLSQRERQILTMRYGLYGTSPKTQREIASILKISRSYVSRIEKSALSKLRDALNS
jgi:RNA polymerase sporulation-specific sigma factor